MTTKSQCFEALIREKAEELHNLCVANNIASLLAFDITESEQPAFERTFDTIVCRVSGDENSDIAGNLAVCQMILTDSTPADLRIEINFFDGDEKIETMHIPFVDNQEQVH